VPAEPAVTLLTREQRRDLRPGEDLRGVVCSALPEHVPARQVADGRLGRCEELLQRGPGDLVGCQAIHSNRPRPVPVPANRL
jgi:hypothetical protein